MDRDEMLRTHLEREHGYDQAHIDAVSRRDGVGLDWSHEGDHLWADGPDVADPGSRSARVRGTVSRHTHRQERRR